MSTYCTPPGLRLIPLTKSQKNCDKPAQIRRPTRCFYVWAGILGKRLGWQLTDTSRDREIARVFVLVFSFRRRPTEVLLVPFEGEREGWLH